MAVDNVLIRDGAICQSFADYTITGGKAGPGGSGQFLAVAFQAAKVLQINTSPTVLTYGILQNMPPANGACDVGIAGITKVVAGAGIAANVEVMVDGSGRIITWTAAGTRYKIGLCLEAAVLNQVVSMLIYTPNIGGTLT